MLEEKKNQIIQSLKLKGFFYREHELDERDFEVFRVKADVCDEGHGICPICFDISCVKVVIFACWLC